MISGTRYRLTAEINRQVNLGREIARLQVEIATGKRIQAPSDDPTGATLVTQLARAQADEAAWMGNLKIAATLSSRADDTLTSVATNLERATELMLTASGDTASDADRATIANELRSIAADLAALADTRNPRGEPLFRTGSPLELPINTTGSIAPVGSRDQVFDNIETAGGPRSIVAILTDAANAVVASSQGTRSTATAASLTAIKAAGEHIGAARADQGVRGNRIDRLIESYEQSAISLEDQRGAIEGTDLTEAIARLQSKQLSLQAAQSVLARVSQSSLFDLLR